MTCASCAHRIERKLNKVVGVTASVNYATEKGQGLLPRGGQPRGPGRRGPQRRVRRHRPARPAPPPGASGEATADADRTSGAGDPLRQRLVVSALLSLPVVVLAMVPPLQLTYWQWLSLTLAAPVVVWGAWPFHRAAWTNLRHGATTMDTLVSLGNPGRLRLWSLYALFLGTAGTPGMRHPFELTVARSDGSGNIYLEAAAGVTTFLLAGRYVEARSKRQAGAALRALMELGAKQVAVLRRGPDGDVEELVPTDRLAVGTRFVVRAR